MQGGRHIQRFVVIVGTRNRNKGRRGVRANPIKKLREPGAAEAADHIPPLDADVAGVLPGFRSSLGLRQTVFSRFLHSSPPPPRPVFPNQPTLIHSLTLYSKILERRHLPGSTPLR